MLLKGLYKTCCSNKVSLNSNMLTPDPLFSGLCQDRQDPNMKIFHGILKND
jgi:hypothetical protein